MPQYCREAGHPFGSPQARTVFRVPRVVMSCWNTGAFGDHSSAPTRSGRSGVPGGAGHLLSSHTPSGRVHRQADGSLPHRISPPNGAGYPGPFPHRAPPMTSTCVSLHLNTLPVLSVLPRERAESSCPSRSGRVSRAFLVLGVSSSFPSHQRFWGRAPAPHPLGVSPLVG